MKKKGFTLIELLAVIVILGLLMAIAIPSVTKYITQSRKKTVSTTIGNYINALTNQVNDMEYTFTGANTVYAVPIECIALERGGTNPFGKWYQASNAYWAYVLVQYDDATSSYTYGFTFKDSAGYGLYPTTSEKLNENGSQIQTGLNLTRPTNGTISNITEKSNWIGFDVKDDTNLVVLEAESEEVDGDGRNTCTLCQKGDNYEQLEQEKKEKYALGKEICFDSNECFNILSSDATTVTLLAKEKIDLTTSNPKQNSNAGTVAVPSNKYWEDNGVLKTKYGGSYPAYVYDDNSPYYKYVEAYEDYLKNDLGISSVNASLISLEQVIDIFGCTYYSNTLYLCNTTTHNSWLVRNYLWWTGTAYNAYNYFAIAPANGGRAGANSSPSGIRPIITVSKTQI